MSGLQIISFGAGPFGEALRSRLGNRLRSAQDALACVGEAGAAWSSRARVVLLIGPEATDASEEMARAVREVAPRAILLCDGGASHRPWCDGVYDPDETPAAFIERLELLWLLGVPRPRQSP